MPPLPEPAAPPHGTVAVRVLSTQHPARNPRAVKEADALAAAGFAVELLTIASHAPSVALDAELLADRPWRLRYAVDLLDPKPAGRLRSLRLRAQTRFARALLRRCRLESPDALGTVRPLLRAALRRPVPLTIVHVDGGLWVGSRLLAAGHRVAADFEDWHSEDLLDESRRLLPLRLLRQVEGTLLHRAAFTTTTSEAMTQALVERYGGRRPHVLPNAFPLQSHPHQLRAGVPRSIIWFSQTVGPGRGLEAFITAWTRTLRPSRLVLVGHANPGYVERLRALVPTIRGGDLVVAGAVAPDALPALIAQHDIGLALEPRVPPNKDLTISNKLLQYLNAGLAVLATPTRGQREVLERGPDASHYIELEQPEHVARTIDDLLSDDDALARKQRASRQLAEDYYCWERYAPAVAQRARDALAVPLR
jgi:glycosyltransferase involved in cell wall biosynthesis